MSVLAAIYLLLATVYAVAGIATCLGGQAALGFAYIAFSMGASGFSLGLMAYARASR